jgi:hypothetical protein
MNSTAPTITSGRGFAPVLGSVGTGVTATGTAAAAAVVIE